MFPKHYTFFIMTKYFYIAVFAIALVLTGCSKKEKTRFDEVQEFRNSLSQQDTTQVLSLSDNCMKLLQEKKIDEAIAMLNEYDDSTKQVKPLSKETNERLRKTFKMFPVLEYSLSYYSMQLEGLNDVKYNITFAKEDNPEQNGQPVTAFMFNPVKVDGQWYLCVKRSDQDIDELRK